MDDNFQVIDNDDDFDNDIVAFLRANHEGNDFFTSLYRQFQRKGTLSDKQRAAVRRSMEPKVAPLTVAATTVDLRPIKAMFDSAVASGYKVPKYRANGLEITRAPDGGKNPGALYVRADDVDIYYGKVLGVTFEPARSAPDHGVEAKLALIAANPFEAAVAYGRRTGRCACCGRLLTDPESIDRGIGPVCATRWGFLA